MFVSFPCKWRIVLAAPVAAAMVAFRQQIIKEIAVELVQFPVETFLMELVDTFQLLKSNLWLKIVWFQLNRVGKWKKLI